MTDYNDGNWHTHDGGPSPVDDETEVQVVWLCDNGSVGTSTDKSRYLSYRNVIAFRVVKRAPREFWINTVAGRDRICRTEPSKPHGYTHVREVIE